MPNSALKELFPSMQAGLKATAALSHGGRMPWLGLGVWKVDGDAQAESTVRTAIELGYRSIDTAMIYENERGVGRGIRNSGLARAELFVTTKLWTDDVRSGRIEEAFDASLGRLGLDYVDLYLVHWPIRGRIGAVWKTLEKIQRSGRARAIGVSNHLIPHLQELLASAEIAPAVNQIEFHPYLQSRPLLELCRKHRIRVEAWSPLMQAGTVLKDPVLSDIARRHGRTVAQVILRWDVQSGVVTIPKSVKKSRLEENASIFDFALTDSDMAAIAALDRNQRVGPDPMNFGF
jgi:diketogulonate reductase-like aldo/keto reductase